MNMKHEMYTLALAAAAATTHADAPSYCSVLFACLSSAVQRFMPLLASDRVRDNAAAIDMT